MTSAAQAILENEVRELVRRRGIDPAVEPEVVGRLVDEVVGEYRDRAITSSLPPMGDVVAASRAVLDAVAGFGPLQPLLDDPTVEEIWINEPGRVFIARNGRSELTTLILTGEQVAELVERMLRPTGRRIDLSTPFVDAMLPDGSRLHVVIPNTTRKCAKNRSAKPRRAGGEALAARSAAGALLLIYQRNWRHSFRRRLILASRETVMASSDAEETPADSDLGDGKICFVIGPIGNRLAPAGTTERQVYEDGIQLLEDVFQPAAEQFGLKIVRADKISETGEIPEQICVLLRDADVVIADLSNANPNVMYELGLRHTRDKLTIPVGEYARLPFDVTTIRTMQFRRKESGLIELRRNLVEALRTGLAGRATPVTATRVWSSEAPSAGVVADALRVSSEADDEVDDFVTGDGYVDILAEGEEAVPKIDEAIERASAALGNLAEIFRASTAEVERMDRQGVGSFAARLKSSRDLAEAMDPAVTEYEAAANDYLDLLHTQDAAVRYLIEAATNDRARLEDSRSYFDAVIGLAEVSVDQSIPVINDYRQTNRGTAKISKSLQPVTRRLDVAMLRFLNGAELIDSWRTAIQAIPGWQTEEDRGEPESQ